MCDQPQPTGIYQAMAEILAEIPSIGKDNKNKEQGFKYRGIDDVYNALHPLLAKHKVFMAPTVLSRASEDRTTAKGGAMQCVTLSVEYRFFHADGSSISCTVMGEGRDTSDKATNKAMAVAHKYALLQTFCIPTEDIGQDDPDAETPEPVQPRQDARPQVMSGPVDFDKVRAELARMTTEEELQEYWKKVRVEKEHRHFNQLSRLFLDRRKELAPKRETPSPEKPRPTSSIPNIIPAAQVIAEFNACETVTALFAAATRLAVPVNHPEIAAIREAFRVRRKQIEAGQTRAA